MSQNANPTVAELFGGGVAPRDTRERLLFTALNLFMAHGFHAVGLDRILTSVGVTKTTFYNHFESKDHLVREAMELRDKWEGDAFNRRLHEIAGHDPRALLLAMFDVWDEWFNRPDYRGCIFLNAAMEFPALHHPVHKAVRQHYASAEAAISSMAKAAGIKDPDALARLWLLLLEGAAIHRVITGENDTARAARAYAAKLLQSELGG